MTLRIIAGKYKGRLLKTPKGPATRPTQSILREALFNICQNDIEGAHLLDLYAGSGAIGCEALSRGAAHVTFVENNRQALTALRSNIALLDLTSQTTLLSYDAPTALLRLTTPFHIIYLDPPYTHPTAPLLETILSRQLLLPGGHLFVEERHTQHREKAPPEYAQIHHQKSRKFGDALLHHYVAV